MNNYPSKTDLSMVIFYFTILQHSLHDPIQGSKSPICHQLPGILAMEGICP